MKSVKLLAASLLVCAFVAHGEEEAAASEPAAAAAKPAEAEARSPFATLPFCKYASGTAEVQKPGGEWSEVDEGKFYPLGTAFRTRGAGKMTVAFGKDASAEIAGDAMFATKAQAISVKSHTLVLGEGTVNVVLPEGLPEGLFFVSAPGFTARDLSGSSRFVYAKTATGDRTVVRCVTGTLGVSGRHFDIPQMRAANVLILSDEHDHLVTTLEDRSGDYLVKLDQGVRTVQEVTAEGATVEKPVEEKAELKLTTKMKVCITRAVPSIGERMSVFVIAFDAAGNPLGSGVSFCEGRAEVNSGVLVKPAKSAAEAESLAKAAAETTEEAVAADDAEASGETAAESSSDDSSSDSSSSSDDDE